MAQWFDSVQVEPIAEVLGPVVGRHPSRREWPWPGGDHKNVGGDTSQKRQSQIYGHCMKDKQEHNFQ